MSSNSEFKHRRKQLLHLMKKKSAAFIAGAATKIRNRDVEFPYRQNSDFYYLTGFAEPDSVAVFLPGRKQGEYLLFCREFDPEKAIWTGRHSGVEGACQEYGADEAFPIKQLGSLLPELLEGRETVYFPFGEDKSLECELMAAINSVRARSRSGIEAPTELVSLDKLIHERRLIKSPHEIQLIKKACEVSVRAHIRAMRYCQPGQHEYEVESELLHEFMMNGCRSVAYPSIVAGGSNACVLHYHENNHILQDGDLLLIDAGAEFESYASDITRTFPVNGHFSESQRIIYELVLLAQQAAINEVKPGNRWNEPHDAAVRVLTKGLQELGILKGKLSNLIKDGAYKKFYMHRTGHWLGMDVHDVGQYMVDEKWREFEPGMVLTVEPGLYFSPDCEDVEPQWRGIGVRIEDDVMVTKAGCEVLTAKLPKTVAEIEAIMAG